MTLINKKEVIYTTIATTSYLPRAMIMAQSVKKHMPNCKVIACIVEEEIPKFKDLNTYFDEVILAKHLGFSNFEQFIFQYSPAEGSNACKAQLLIYLLETYKNHNYFVFLDADTKAYGPFQELMEHLERSEIVISPHFIRFNKEDPFYHLGIIHASGIFNTGFFGIKRGDEATEFLHWWANILLRHCYISPKKGLWNEQKWLDLAPGIFNFYIQKDPGYNVGPWNFHERYLSLSGNEEYLVNGKPLRLFHFSGVHNSFFNHKMSQAELYQQKLIASLKREYTQELLDVDKNLLSEAPWSYDSFLTGQPIHKKSRLIFRKILEISNHIDNPFLKNNEFLLSIVKLGKNQKNKKRKRKV